MLQIQEKEWELQKTCWRYQNWCEAEKTEGKLRNIVKIWRTWQTLAGNIQKQEWESNGQWRLFGIKVICVKRKNRGESEITEWKYEEYAT